VFIRCGLRQTGSQLEHLSVSLPSDPDLAEAWDNCWQQLRQQCNKLESLHLDLPQINLDGTLDNIAVIGHGLRFLTIEDNMPWGHADEIRSVCSSCPNLEQLSLEFPECFILPTT
jgi:hypothetical protein